jgi:hypothetical protein
VEDALRLQFSSFRINASLISFAEQSSFSVFSSASPFEATATNGPNLAPWTPALIEAFSLAELVSVHLELSGLQVQVSNEASSFMTNAESLSSATLVAALAPVNLICTCPTRYAHLLGQNNSLVDACASCQVCHGVRWSSAHVLCFACTLELSLHSLKQLSSALVTSAHVDLSCDLMQISLRPYVVSILSRLEASFSPSAPPVPTPTLTPMPFLPRRPSDIPNTPLSRRSSAGGTFDMHAHLCICVSNH